MHAPPGWLKGKCGDKIGLFPENYVEKITEEEAKAASNVRSPSPEEERTPEVSVKSLAASISQQLSGGGMAAPSSGVGGSSVSTRVEQETATSARTTQSAVTTTTSDGNVCIRKLLLCEYKNHMWTERNISPNQNYLTVGVH